MEMPTSPSTAEKYKGCRKFDVYQAGRNAGFLFADKENSPPENTVLFSGGLLIGEPDMDGRTCLVAEDFDVNDLPPITAARVRFDAIGGTVVPQAHDVELTFAVRPARGYDILYPCLGHHSGISICVGATRRLISY